MNSGKWMMALRSPSALSRVAAILIIHSTLFIDSGVRAQGYAYHRKHLEFYDDKTIHYGFFFAMPVSRFTVKYSPDFVTNSTVERLYSPNTVNFRVGLLVNAFLTERFDFRFTPAVSLYGRKINYEFVDKATARDERESTWMEFPFLFKYKSERRRNSRMYLIAGATGAIETNVRRGRASTSGRLSTKTTDLTLDYGLGFEQFLEYTKISPELRFSHGIVNLFDPGQVTPSGNAAGIRRLTSHTVTLYLNFE